MPRLSRCTLVRSAAVAVAWAVAWAVVGGSWQDWRPASDVVGAEVAGAQEDGGGTVHLPLVFGRYGPRPTVSPTKTPGPAQTTPAPTHTPASPTRAPTQAPTSAPKPIPTPDVSSWRAFVGYHRAMAGLPGVVEEPAWSRGCQLHAQYMVKNYVIGHSEDPRNRHYTPEGDEAAKNGNVYLMAATDRQGTFLDAIDGWMTGPFHMLAIIDPRLVRSGFGEHAETVGRMMRYGATLDVQRGTGEVPEGVTYPVYYPIDGGRMPNLLYDGGEFPDPLLACPGYTEPTGPPIALQLGTGDIVPNVTRSTVLLDGEALAHCRFDETDYPGELGRLGLDLRDAIIVMPRQPLSEGSVYDVEIAVNGESYAWSFTAGR